MDHNPASAHRSRRLVLRKHDSHSAISKIADTMGWEKIGETENKSSRKKALHAAWEMSPGVRLSYLNDAKEQTSYLVVTSKSNPNLEPYLTQLVDAGIDPHTPDELAQEADSAKNPRDKGLSLIRAGIGAPETPIKSYIRIFFESMRNSSPMVRMSGLTAIGYAEWPQFLELLDAVSVEDDDNDVKNHARRIADAFRKAERDKP